MPDTSGEGYSPAREGGKGRFQRPGGPPGQGGGRGETGNTSFPPGYNELRRGAARFAPGPMTRVEYHAQVVAGRPGGGILGGGPWGLRDRRRPPARSGGGGRREGA